MATALDDRDLALLLAGSEEITEAIRLTLAYTIELADIAEQVGGIVRTAFIDLTHTDRADIAEFITEAEPYVRAGIDDASDLAAAYISEVTGATLTPAEIVIPDIGWTQPFERTWHQLKEGDLYLDAKASGSTVADQIAHDAAIDGASRRMANAQKQLGIRGWRRVVTAKACEWCRVVATQFYRSEKTATFGHHGCRCIVVPVFNEQHDTAEAINKARLGDLRKEGAVQKVSDSRVRSKARERAEKTAAARAGVVTR
jgi:hypothetical protein